MVTKMAKDKKKDTKKKAPVVVEEETTGLNKGDVISRMAEITGDTKASAEKNLNAFIQTVTEGLVENDKVMLMGFGTFKKSEMSERIGQNPKNPSEKIKIAASTRINFSAGKQLKDSVNGRTEKKKTSKEKDKKKDKKKSKK